MNKLYMGIDIGMAFAKGVIIDGNNNILASSYLDTLGNPIRAVKAVIREMREEIDLDKYQVVSVGVTGSARKLIGLLLNANTIRNEVTALAVGTIRLYPDVKTIFEIGGYDSKIILVNDGVVTDYGLNTACMAGTGIFISNLAKRLDIDINEISKLALKSKNRIRPTTKCMLFADADINDKLQKGYQISDILAGVCKTIVSDYLNNVAKGKKIQSPIVFNGGVSKNQMIVKCFEEELNEKIIVNRNSHLMAALGIAIMARESKKENVFNLNIDNYKLETKVINCVKCSNNCEMVMVYRNDKLIDYWGNKCKHDNLIKQNS